MLPIWKPCFLDARCQIPDARYQMPDARCLFIITGIIFSKFYNQKQDVSKFRVIKLFAKFWHLASGDWQLTKKCPFIDGHFFVINYLVIVFFASADLSIIAI